MEDHPAYKEALAGVPEEHFDDDRFAPGVGPLDADVMVVGEAPGKQEVEQNEPFVGNAGRRLDSILEDVGATRADLYITNVVKVRPPENRTPHIAEIDAWLPVLEAEIGRIDPEGILTVGNTPTQALLDTDDGITDLRGKTFEYDDHEVYPTFHPAATFYDESKRDAIQADLERAFERA